MIPITFRRVASRAGSPPLAPNSWKNPGPVPPCGGRPPRFRLPARGPFGPGIPSGAQPCLAELRGDVLGGPVELRAAEAAPAHRVRGEKADGFHHPVPGEGRGKRRERRPRRERADRRARRRACSRSRRPVVRRAEEERHRRIDDGPAPLERVRGLVTFERKIGVLVIVRQLASESRDRRGAVGGDPGHDLVRVPRVPRGQDSRVPPARHQARVDPHGVRAERRPVGAERARDLRDEPVLPSEHPDRAPGGKPARGSGADRPSRARRRDPPLGSRARSRGPSRVPPGRSAPTPRPSSCRRPAARARCRGKHDERLLRAERLAQGGRDLVPVEPAEQVERGIDIHAQGARGHAQGDLLRARFHAHRGLPGLLAAFERHGDGNQEAVGSFRRTRPPERPTRRAPRAGPRAVAWLARVGSFCALPTLAQREGQRPAVPVAAGLRAARGQRRRPCSLHPLPEEPAEVLPRGPREGAAQVGERRAAEPVGAVEPLQALP